MIRIYASDVTVLEQADTYARARGSVLEARRHKADAYRFLPDRCRCLGAGLLLRQACGEHGIPYDASSFTMNEYGKPDFADNSLHFSLSHAGKFALCAVSGAEVGCDVEEIRPFETRIADRFFAAEEKAALSLIQDEREKLALFFRLWTAKESFVKCVGLGLNLPFHDFAVSFAGAAPLVRQHYDDAHYSLGERAAEGYQFAWCVKGKTNAENAEIQWI